MLSTLTDSTGNRECSALHRIEPKGNYSPQLTFPNSRLSVFCSLWSPSAVLLTSHTLHRTLLQTGAALQESISPALGGGEEFGCKFSLIFFGEGNWRIFFLFFTILCGIAKFLHLGFFFFFKGALFGRKWRYRKRKQTFAKPRNIVKQKKTGLTWAPYRAHGSAAEIGVGCDIASIVHAGASHREAASESGLCGTWKGKQKLSQWGARCLFSPAAAIWDIQRESGIFWSLALGDRKPGFHALICDTDIIG